MATVVLLWVTLVCSRLVLTVWCNEDTHILLQTINTLKTDVNRIEERTRQEIDFAKVNLKSELTETFREMILEFIDEGGSEKEMVLKKMFSEIRQLKRVTHHMKKQIRGLVSSTKTLREELDDVRLGIDSNEMSVCSKYIVDTKVLQRELGVCRGQTHVASTGIAGGLSQLKVEFQTLNQSCHHINSDTKRSLEKLNVEFQNLNQSHSRDKNDTKVLLKKVNADLQNLNQSHSRDKNDTMSLLEKVNADMHNSNQSCTSVASTTVIPGSRWRRMVVAFEMPNSPLYSVDLQNNTLKVYGSPIKHQVTALAYIPKDNKLLIATHSPDIITTFDLGSKQRVVFKDNVRTWGMAVDDEENVIFMTTVVPSKKIYRITTSGGDFRLVVDLLYLLGSYPREISLDENRKKIYVCNEGSVFMLNYDGSELQTLATGTNMFALTFSKTDNVLYYNANKKIMSYSANGTNSIVTLLDVVPWNMAHNGHIVYFSSSEKSQSTIGAVGMRANGRVHVLQRNLQAGKYRHTITLIP